MFMFRSFLLNAAGQTSCSLHSRFYDISRWLIGRSKMVVGVLMTATTLLTHIVLFTSYVFRYVCILLFIFIALSKY
ncbi:hypothetical protein BDV39DRAFT_176162, partial [Aspergillus sergii]